MGAWKRCRDMYAGKRIWGERQRHDRRTRNMARRKWGETQEDAGVQAWRLAEARKKWGTRGGINLRALEKVWEAREEPHSGKHLPTRMTFLLVPDHAPFTKFFSLPLRSRLFLRHPFSIGPNPLATHPHLSSGPRLVLCQGGGGHRSR